MKINNKENKLQCSKCGEWKPKVKDFYMSQSKMYENNDKRIPLCKTCLNERYEELYEKYNDEMKAMHHWCINFDVYFSEANFESAFSQAGREGSVSIVGIYMKNANSMRQNKGKTSLQSEIIVNQIEEIKEAKKDKESFEVTSDIRKRWGREYSDEECMILEDYYEDYYNNYNHEHDYGKLDILKEVSGFKLIIAQAKRDKDNRTIREFTTLISQRMADAGLKPSQQRKLGEADDDLYSLKLKILEKTKPVGTPLEEYLDVDKFWAYINRNMIKPFAMALGLAKGEYSIEEGNENIELDEKLKSELDGVLNEN